MVHGLWFMVYGAWFIVYGEWFLFYGSKFRVKGDSFLKNGVRGQNVPPAPAPSSLAIRYGGAAALSVLPPPAGLPLLEGSTAPIPPLDVLPLPNLSGCEAPRERALFGRRAPCSAPPGSMTTPLSLPSVTCPPVHARSRVRSRVRISNTQRFALKVSVVHHDVVHPRNGSNSQHVTHFPAR
jgi:hypothetical protein